MSVFVRLEKDDLEDMEENSKFAKNAVLNLRDSTFKIQSEIKLKHEAISKARGLVNSAHDELVRLVEMMPQTDPLTSLNIKTFRTTTFDLDTDLLDLKKRHEISGNKHQVLKNLGKRISELK